MLTLAAALAPLLVGLHTTAATAGTSVHSSPATPLAPVVYEISTHRPVVFITIDDGWFRVHEFRETFRDAGVPASLFLTRDAADTDYHYFQGLVHDGATAEDHSISHPEFPTLTYQQQKRQICSTARSYRDVFGRRPTLFRPPYGEFNRDTRAAAAACRMHAVVNWDVTVNNGRLAYAAGDHLQPGDIILMHFTSNIVDDFTAAKHAAHQAGLRVASLEDYL